MTHQLVGRGAESSWVFGVLLTQHLLAAAALFPSRQSKCNQSSHSMDKNQR
jgi:hypothetical protein